MKASNSTKLHWMRRLRVTLLKKRILYRRIGKITLILWTAFSAKNPNWNYSKRERLPVRLLLFANSNYCYNLQLRLVSDFLNLQVFGTHKPGVAGPSLEEKCFNESWKSTSTECFWKWLWVLVNSANCCIL